MDIIIREARSDEILETALIYIESQQEDFPFLPEAYTSYFDPDVEVEECREWLEIDPINQIYVAMDGDRMAGYIALSKNSDEFVNYEGEIAGFFVRKSYRGKGIGLRLMKVGAAYLSQMGYKDFLVYTLHYGVSEGFYRRLGGKLLAQVTQNFGGEEQVVDILGYNNSVLLQTIDARLRMYEERVLGK